MSLFKRKPKFFYEVYGSTEIEEVQLSSIKELVEYIYTLDNQLRCDYLESEICITKVKNDLKGQVFVEETFTLPKAEGFNWSAALSKFSTKKPIPFQKKDTKISKQDTVNEDLHETHEEKMTLEEFEKNVDTTMAEKEISDETEITDPDFVTQTVKEKKPEQESKFVQLTQSELNALYEKIQEQENETIRLRKEVEWQTNSESLSKREIPSIESNISSIEVKEKEDSIDLSVSELLKSTKTIFDETLTAFIEVETKKIESEISQLDKRYLINRTVSDRIKLEEKDKLEQLSTQLAEEKSSLLQEEEMRHQQKCQEILSKMEEKEQTLTETIETEMEDKRSKIIKDEYKLQTENLSRLLQEKLDKLQISQQAMNDGLKANFEETLNVFNSKHLQVIEEIEKKKEEVPIDLDEHRKKRHA